MILNRNLVTATRDAEILTTLMSSKKMIIKSKILEAKHIYYYAKPVVLTNIFPVAAVAVTVGLRWPLYINHTKKAVKFKFTFKLYQYFSHLGISACFKHRHVAILIFSLL
jgi:hypothetical protein